MADTTIETTIDTHLEAYCEPDAERRAELISRVWAADGQLLDPPFDGTGHEALASLAEAVLSNFPDHRFQRTSAIDTHHNIARYGWELVAADGAVAVAGLDVADIGPDGRLQRVVGFFGPLPDA